MKHLSWIGQSRGGREKGPDLRGALGLAFPEARGQTGLKNLSPVGWKSGGERGRIEVAHSDWPEQRREGNEQKQAG